MIQIYVATEDALSEAVANRLVAEVGPGLEIVVRFGRKGNSYLRQRFSELAKTARHIPVLLMADLDLVGCAPTLVAKWSHGVVMPSGLLFRVAVREIEAWLMADRQGFSNFFRVPLAMVPLQPETIDDPKQLLLNLVRRYSDREVKAAILPERGARAKIGLGYNLMLSHFVEESWSISRAVTISDSLARTYRRLTELRTTDRENPQPLSGAGL